MADVNNRAGLKVIVHAIDSASWAAPSAREKRSFISMVTLSVHTSPSQKRSFSKTLFKPGGNLKTELFD